MYVCTEHSHQGPPTPRSVYQCFSEGLSVEVFSVCQTTEGSRKGLGTHSCASIAFPSPWPPLSDSLGPPLWTTQEGSIMTLCCEVTNWEPGKGVWTGCGALAKGSHRGTQYRSPQGRRFRLGHAVTLWQRAIRLISSLTQLAACREVT